MTAAPTGAAHFAPSARVSAAIAHVARLARCADLKTIACHKPSLQLQCAFRIQNATYLLVLSAMQRLARSR